MDKLKLLKTYVKTFCSSFIDKHKDRKTYIVIAATLFVLLYSYKVTLYTNYIVPSSNKYNLLYKFSLTIIWSIIIFSLIFCIKYRVFFITLYILLLTYMTISLIYFMYFHNYFHLTLLFALFNEGVITGTRLSIPMTKELLILLIDLPVALFLILKYKTLHQKMLEIKIAKRVLIIASLISIICVEIVNFQAGKSIIQIVANQAGSESITVELYGTIVNDLTTILNQKSAKSFVYGKEIKNEVETEQKPNIILIQLESVDSNIVNKLYKNKYVMPYLQSITNKSIYYPFAMSYHMGGGSSDSEFSVINSIQPFSDFPAIKLANYFYPNSLITKLKENSYTTIAFHGNNGSFYNRDVAFPKMGFDIYYDYEKMNRPVVGWGVSDKDTFEFAENYLQTGKNPFIAYIISLTSHTPYNFVREVYNNKLYDDINDELVKNYFNSMTYLDQCLEDFIEKVRKQHENTYIFIYGDHAPDVNTLLFKQASFTINDKHFEFVPLFILTPDNTIYKENKAVASFLDILPTVLNASGVKFNAKSDGINLLDRSSPLNTIPYKGNNFNRIDLFKMASGDGS